MPLSYSRDDEARRIRLSVSPPFTKDDAIKAVYRQAAEGTWQYGALVDLRRGILDSSALSELIAHIRELVAVHGARGPLALVAWETAATKQLRAFAGDARLLADDIAVFRNTNDAERWLDRWMSSEPGASA